MFILNLHPLTIPDKLIHIEWKVLAHFCSFVALHQWRDLEAGRVPYTIFLPDLKVSVGFTTIGRLLQPAVTKQDRPKPKACSGKDWQRCDKTFIWLATSGSWHSISELWLCQRSSICSGALQVLSEVRRAERCTPRTVFLQSPVILWSSEPIFWSFLEARRQLRKSPCLPINQCRPE